MATAVCAAPSVHVGTIGSPRIGLGLPASLSPRLHAYSPRSPSLLANEVFSDSRVWSGRESKSTCSETSPLLAKGLGLGAPFDELNSTPPTYRRTHRRTHSVNGSPSSLAESIGKRATRGHTKDSPVLVGEFEHVAKYLDMDAWSSAARYTLVGAFALVLIGVMRSFTGNSSLAQLIHKPAFFDHPVCDPFSLPGYLAFDESNLMATEWRPFSQSCPPAPDYLRMLRTAYPTKQTLARIQESYDASGDHKPANLSLSVLRGTPQAARASAALQFMRGKSVLMIGDSVDRNALDDIATLMDREVQPTSYSDPEVRGAMEGWDPRNQPYTLQIPELDFQMFNSFHYGMDDTDEHSGQADWHAPGKVEDRLDQLFGPMIDMATNNHGPDLILFHSGMWDAAYWGRLDKKQDRSTATALSQKRLEWYTRRFKSTLREIRHRYPHARLVVRQMHRIGQQALSASKDWGPGIEGKFKDGKFSSFFADVRVHQIRELTSAICQEEGLEVFDFGRMWEGYQARQDKVHPMLFPSGPIFGAAVLHQLYLGSIDGPISAIREHFHPHHS
ncbi:uncharacterized protein L969DRAFT_84401 [Mixia osmundae IAM 14324]|uniref:Uncharacterized protein n=1 Tax=Mixia osmundae (strain CBS 9802 / IAM 14324 / JCM 22182 / KY 12970) TaxID=764103 RepID=G7E2Z4_MIXOS|nr:uncharacterized protein L969DRAFT_84401 [Mixia osmundae IAM 14324]KEI42536.1 hypothetical protein L969DRAFT_84401 [Mixia osmundae IAM 14324]GAA97175.1 hypothetical protein E5Q_03851 [Mixia osmundae IAM 14324]